MKTIGFTEKFYTLWEVGQIYAEPVFYNGLQVGTNYKQDITYLQNLATDLDRAKEKISGEYQIDLELRGHSSFKRTVSSDIKNREDYYEHDCFSFGKMEGVRFVDATDIWQLNRAFSEEKSARRRAIARRRLIELGALVKYRIGNYNYATPEQVAEDRINKMSGHHFTDGAKVELEVKEIKRFGFDGAYGWTSIRIYETICGKIVKYVGSSPIDLPNEWSKIKATIKHDNYRGAETKLLRMKTI